MKIADPDGLYEQMEKRNVAHKATAAQEKVPSTSIQLSNQPACVAHVGMLFWAIVHSDGTNNVCQRHHFRESVPCPQIPLKTVIEIWSYRGIACAMCWQQLYHSKSIRMCDAVVGHPPPPSSHFWSSFFLNAILHHMPQFGIRLTSRDRLKITPWCKDVQHILSISFSCSVCTYDLITISLHSHNGAVRMLTLTAWCWVVTGPQFKSSLRCKGPNFQHVSGYLISKPSACALFSWPVVLLLQKLLR